MDNNSRVDKFEKRRKNTKSISLFLVAGGILLIVLLAMFLFGGGEEKAKNETSSTDSQSENSNNNSTNEDSSNNEPKNETTTDENDEATSDESSSSDDEASSDTEKENQDEEKNEDEAASDDLEKETVEGSDDPNVLEAYTANWEPIGTEQEGTHTKEFAEGTQDRKEMEEAIRIATGLKQGDMITWWLENGGGNQVIGTVSNKAQDKTYRVYLSWVENEGWKPTKVEVLKENDKD